MNKITKTMKLLQRKQSLTQVLIISLVIAYVTPVTASNNYQHKMLFTPTGNLLKAEQRGRVMVYDSLSSRDVDKALDTQFDRIENMMFVRMSHVSESGEVIESEDDCD